MTTDIVERINHGTGDGWEALAKEAAAEIKVLRAALQDIAEDPYAVDGGAAEIARAALKDTTP